MGSSHLFHRVCGILVGLGIAAALGFTSRPAHAGLEAYLYASGLSVPVYATAPAGDARLFVVELRMSDEAAKERHLPAVLDALKGVVLP